MNTDRRRPSNPDRTPWENHSRRMGTRLLVTGITIGSITFVALLSLAYLHPGVMRGETLLFTILAALVVTATAAALTNQGIAERMQRPVRWVGWQNLQHGEQTSANVAAMTAALTSINDRLGALDERMERLEKRIDDLPGYGEGVVDGATLRAQVSREAP